MKISEMRVGQMAYTQLDRRVLAVLVRRVDGWCVYVGAVPGKRHSAEWADVAAHGTKQRKPMAIAIAQGAFHPGFEVDVPYAA